MQIEFSIPIGKMTLTIRDEAASQKQALELIGMWQGLLPTRGPNNGPLPDDLVVRHRHVKNGDFDFYSIASPSLNMEFQLGCLKLPVGALFPKGWVSVQYGQQDDDDREQEHADPFEGRREAESSPTRSEPIAATADPDPLRRPRANHLAEMITPKQIISLRQLAEQVGLVADRLIETNYLCQIDELSAQAASAIFNLWRAGDWPILKASPSVAPLPAAAPTSSVGSSVSAGANGFSYDEEFQRKRGVAAAALGHVHHHVNGYWLVGVKDPAHASARTARVSRDEAGVVTCTCDLFVHGRAAGVLVECEHKYAVREKVAQTRQAIAT